MYLGSVYKPHSVRGAWFRRNVSVTLRHCAIISLGGASPRRSGAAYPGLTASPCEVVRMKTSSLPSSTDDFVPAWPCSRRGLPGRPHYCGRRWSLARNVLCSPPPFHPCLCRPVSDRPTIGGMSLWPDPAGNLVFQAPVPGVTRRRALRSADFPRPGFTRAAATRPTCGRL